MLPVLSVFSDALPVVNIFDAFHGCVAEYGIHVAYAITDNDSSMKKAFNYFVVEPADLEDVDEKAECAAEDLGVALGIVMRRSCFPTHFKCLQMTD